MKRMLESGDVEISDNISFLLDKQKTAREGENLTGLLPCYFGLKTKGIKAC